MSEQKQKGVLIGVGGSGQHVVHAYLRLLALANVDAISVPHVFIVDADAKENAATESDCLLAQNIAKLHESLTAPLQVRKKSDGKPSGSHAPLCRLIHPSPGKDAGGVDKALDIQDSSLWTNALLMEDDTAVDVRRGMYANARVGASVFGVKMSHEDMKEMLAAVRGAHVAIVGSTFGGTGSGVIPALVNFLDNLDEHSPGGEPLSVRAFMTLPWFELTASSGGDASAARAQGGITPMERNASLGLRTYIHEMEGSLKRSNYLVSQFLGPSAVKRIDNGNYNQAENPHVFNLILANTIQHYLQGDYKIRDMLVEGSKRHLLTLAAADSEKDGVFSAKQSSHLRIRVGEEHNRSLEDVVKDAELLALALEKGADFIRPGEKQFVGPGAGADSHKEPKELSSFLKFLADEQPASPANYTERKSSPFSRPEKYASERVYTDLSDSLRAVSVTLRASLLWLEDHELSEESRSGLLLSPDIQRLFKLRGTRPKGDYRSLDGMIEPLTEPELSPRWPAYRINSIRSYQTNKVFDDNVTGMFAAKTPCVAKAFVLLMNVFFEKEARGGSAVAVPLQDEIKTRIGNQTDRNIYDVAAQVIAERVHDEILKFREVTQTRNAEDVAPISDGASPMLTHLPERAKPVPITSRVSRIDAATLKPDIKDARSERHPLGFRHLDPYVGVDSVLKLLPQQGNAPEQVFPETALKGIPNILAPRLLQQWRLECRPADHELSSSLQALYETKPPRSTSFGIYLHARRIIEAAFWLLFTQDPRVEIVRHVDEGRNGFERLVRKEFEIHGEWSSYFIRLKSSGDILFIHDTKLGWYPGANKPARQFLAEVMPELPSVKYGNGQLDAFWRGEAYASQPLPNSDSFEANVLVTFIKYLEGLANGEGQALWRVAIKDLLAELNAKGIDGKRQTATDLAESGFEIPLETLPERVAHVKLKVLAALQKFTRLLLDSPFYFQPTSEASGRDIRQMVWPVKGDAWQFINEKGNNGFQVSLKKAVDANGSRSEWCWDELRLDLDGFGEKAFKNPFRVSGSPGQSRRIPGIDTTDNLFWSVGIWPDFRAEGWSYYIAGGDCTQPYGSEIKNFDLKGNSLKAECLEYVYFGEIYEDGKPRLKNGTPEFGEIGRVSGTVPIKLSGIPRSVELHFAGQILGSVPIALKSLNPATPPECTIALDFGTSNTCMAIRRGNESPVALPILAGEGLEGTGFRVQESTWSAGNLRSGDQYFHQRLPTLFFHAFNQQTGQGDVRSIPSELLFVSGASNDSVKRKVKGYIKDNAEKFKAFKTLSMFGRSANCLDNGGGPVVTPVWTPFPPNINKHLQGLLKSEYSSSQDVRYVDNFKWPVQDTDYAYRAVYLESILVACFASLRQLSYSKIDGLIATYPGAFSCRTKDSEVDGEKESFQKDLKLVVDYLKNRCGLDIAKDIMYRSETISALVSCHRDAKDISLTIDMGGGTTDIGLIVPDQKDPMQFESYMASLRYAGNDLLRAIIQRDIAAEVATGVNDPLPEQSRLMKMKLDIRQHAELVGDPERARSFDVITQAFFRGLLEYVFTLMSAFARKENFPAGVKINVHFFGNGFNLVPVFCKKTAIELFNQIATEAVKCGLLTEDLKRRFDTSKTVADDRKKNSLIEGAFSASEADGDKSREAKQHDKVEIDGHNRVPVWLPGVHALGKAWDQATLGTREEQQWLDDPAVDAGLTFDGADEARLVQAFPLTSRYWKDVGGVRGIFSRIPITQYPSLGQFYLEGKRDKTASFVGEVLYKLDKDPVEKRTIPGPAATVASTAVSAGTNAARTVSDVIKRVFSPPAVSADPAPVPSPPPCPPQPSQLPPTRHGHVIQATQGSKHALNAQGRIAMQLGWQAAFDMDVLAFVLDANDRVTRDEDTVFYGQTTYAGGVVHLNTPQKTLSIDLDALPAGVSRIAVCVVTGIDDADAAGKSFGQVRDAFITIKDALGTEVLRFALENSTGTETAMIFGEIYRYRGEWKFNAVGQGYSGGFKALCDRFGVAFSA